MPGLPQFIPSAFGRNLGIFEAFADTNFPPSLMATSYLHLLSLLAKEVCIQFKRRPPNIQFNYHFHLFPAKPLRVSIDRMVWQAVLHSCGELSQSGTACVVAMTIGAARADIATGSGNPAANTVINGGLGLVHTIEQQCRHTYPMAQRTKTGYAHLLCWQVSKKMGATARISKHSKLQQSASPRKNVLCLESERKRT